MVCATPKVVILARKSSLTGIHVMRHIGHMSNLGVMWTNDGKSLQLPEARSERTCWTKLAARSQFRLSLVALFINLPREIAVLSEHPIPKSNSSVASINAIPHSCWEGGKGPAISTSCNEIHHLGSPSSGKGLQDRAIIRLFEVFWAFTGGWRRRHFTKPVQARKHTLS